ncbi:MAG: carboxymuconolactone decarboxylase family protein [Verrucomicrobiae bacterium]|nr:carboxymuconolactone decarboxylase family protein [Verrucomicrobiae bacterium]
MWRLTPVDPKEFAAELPSKAGHSGNGISQFLTLLANSPASLKAFLQAEQALGNGQLTPAQREEISILVAEINGSNYCLAAHELAGKEAGLCDQEIWSARKALASDPKTKAMLNFVQAVVLQRGEINDDDFFALRNAGFADSQIIEILTNIVLNIFTNYFNLLARTNQDRPLSWPVGKGGPAGRIVPANTATPQT